jgi:ATP-dependent RNA helicase RhlE
LAEILKDQAIQRTLVFTRTKHGANRAAEYLYKARIPAEAIHGNKSQSARERALENFKAGKTRVLVATDIAARGIDVPGITHVINFDLPNVPESYVHRIGRTARAGRAGVALSFCDVEEREFLRDIEKLIGLELSVVENHPYKSTVSMDYRPRPSAPSANRRPPPRQNRRGGGGGRSHHARF